MCQVDDFDLPRVTLTFSEAGLNSVTVQCQMYASKMQQISRQQSLSRYSVLVLSSIGKNISIQHFCVCVWWWGGGGGGGFLFSSFFFFRK